MNCGISYNPGKKYLEKRKDGFYNLTEEGVKLIKNRRLRGLDKCISLTVILSNGEIVPPDSTNEEILVQFTFNLPLEKTKRFKYKITEIESASGEKILVNFEGEMKLEDKTRFRFFSPM